MATITIDGKVYDTESLSDEAKAHIQSLKFCDQKVNDLNNELAVVNTARNAYARELQGMLPKDS